MPRIDISRLRKERSMSQNELAQLLQINQSFLSAIENGKSPLPPEKEAKLREIFHINDLSPYKGSRKVKEHDETEDMSDSDLFNQLLNRFHKQAHSHEEPDHHHDHHERISQLEQRIEGMMERNDRLMQRNESLAIENDELRKEAENLRREIYRLKTLLMNAGVSC